MFEARARIASRVAKAREAWREALAYGGSEGRTWDEKIVTRSGINRNERSYIAVCFPIPRRWHREKIRSFLLCLAQFALLLPGTCGPSPSRAEIPLKHCGNLPVIEVEVGQPIVTVLGGYGGDFVLDLKSFCRREEARY